MKILNCSKGTIQRRLREGNEYKLCDYDKKRNMKNHKVTNPNNGN